MTTITIDRTIVEQALEALEWYAECSVVSGKAADAADALRAALEQEQAEPEGESNLPPPLQEHGSTEQRIGETPPSDYRRGYWDGFNIGKREGRIDAEDAAQQAEPVQEQEPVAWMVYTEGGTSAYVTDNPNDLVGAYRALPLYTTPPQRRPLSGLEVEQLLEQVIGSLPVARNLIRAVERAHGIGEKE